MKVYKITTQDNKTRPGCNNETLWGEGITHETSGGGELCGKGWLHAYESVELALFMNPAHANIQHPRLWEAEAEGAIKREAVKIGCTQLTTLREIPYTPPTWEQCVRFAILCALKVYSEPSWVVWANGWLDGTDRESTYAVAAADVYTAASYASSAHSTASYAAAVYASYAAAEAAVLADRAVIAPIDFDAIAKSAMSGEAGK